MWSRARLRRFTIGWLVADTSAVALLRAAAGGDAGAPPAAVVATTTVLVALAGVALAIVASACTLVPEQLQICVLRVSAVVAVLAVPAWLVVARLAA